MEIMLRGYNEKVPFSSGLYKIQPKQGKTVETFCDFDRYAGGWTLVTKASTHSGWTKEKVIEHNSNDASQADYSIFGLIDDMKNVDDGEVKIVNTFSFRCCFHVGTKIVP